MENSPLTKHVVIAGGRGFLGQGLSWTLHKRGYAVTILSRSAAPAQGFPPGIKWRQWNARTLGDWVGCLRGATAVVNLVGRSVDCRKTEENKRVILESRINSCHALGEALRAPEMSGAIPAVWIQAGTAHIVGDPEPRDTICDESTPPGPLYEMAPSVGVAWELAFHKALLPNQRGVMLRISFVLGPHGGAMSRLSRLTRWGFGGTVGRGDQWISWIHQHDLNRLIITAIEDPSYTGVYMTTAPQPVTNRQFMQAMRRGYHRPWSPPAPGFAVRFACRFLLNSDPDLALLGRRCVPARLCDEQGFQFKYSTIDDAIHACAQGDV